MSEEDPMATPRGCLFGVIVGTGIWAIAVTIAMIIWKALQK